MSVIAAAGDGATLTEIARAAKLASSTAHRLLTTLQQDRFVQFKPDGARWMVGVGAFTVGSAFLGVRDIARGARPLLRRLMEQSGETANLAILSDDMAVYLEQVECLQTVRAICKPGGRVVLHSTSLGKSMLAAMRPQEVSRILATKGMTRFTPRTIASPAQMAVELNAVRASATRSTMRNIPRVCAAWRQRCWTSMASRSARSQSRVRRSASPASGCLS